MILDLYACAGGWDEGARLAGLGPTIGIEIEDDPCRTAIAAGHPRIRADVATHPTAPFAGKLAGLIASPPCQAWSSAGKRLGERDRARVHALVDRYAAGDPTAESAGTEAGWADPDSHHAAQPVRWIRDLLPPWVAMEQVPPVLPLWRHIARVIRPWGYTTWCGILNAADYGVPQTRRRAFLLASRIGVALPPEPTHAQDPVDGLFGTRLHWVSMAEALGWDGIERPARTVCGDRSPRWAYGEGNSYGTGWTLVGNQKPDRASGEYQSRPGDLPSQTITSQAHLYRWLETENRSETADGRVPYLRSTDRPAPTVVSNADRWELHTRRDGPAWVAEHGERCDRAVTEPAPTLTGEAHRWSLRNGNQENACERRACEPAGTLFFGERCNDVRWVLASAHREKVNDRTRPRSLDEPAMTVAFGHSDMSWVQDRPATTVQADPRIGRPGHKDRAGGEAQFEQDSVRITNVEAAVLQSFRPDYPWHGTKTSVFSQIGNAVPPLLAAAVLSRLATSARTTGLPAVVDEIGGAA